MKVRMFSTSAVASAVLALAVSSAAAQHEIVRNRSTFQTGPSDLTPLRFEGLFSVRWDEPDDVTGVYAATNDGSFEVELSRVAPDSNRFEYRTPNVDSVEELEALIPYGTYDLSLFRSSGPDLFASLSDGTPRFTNIPLFTNYDAFGSYDATQDFAVEWEAMSGGNALALQIFGDDGFYYVQELGIESTGTVIPADTLLPDRRYVFSLVFANFVVVDDEGFDGTSIGQSFYQHFTEAEFVTVPTPSAAGLLVLASLAATRRRR